MKPCLIKQLKNIKEGTRTEVTFCEGKKIQFIYIERKKDCIIGLTDEGIITIDLHCIKTIRSIPFTSKIFLFNPGTIDCQAEICGKITYSYQGVPNEEVTLISIPDMIEFEKNPLTTNESGMFCTKVTIPKNTQPTPVKIVASAKVNCHDIETSINVLVKCLECKKPSLTLNVPSDIKCEGQISGELTYCGEPVQNTPVFFEISNEQVEVLPNPVLTDEHGTLQATLKSKSNVNETITIQATTTVDSKSTTVGPYEVSVDCRHIQCPCKFRLETAGAFQPGALIKIIDSDHEQELIGHMNINVIQCGASVVGPCNPAVNNFNFTFVADSGKVYNFTMGRRTFIKCDMNTAHLTGTAKSNSFGQLMTFTVEIKATLDSNIVTWEIHANNGQNITFETSTPFVAPASPQSFIANCP